MPHKIYKIKELLSFLGPNTIIVDRSLPKNPVTKEEFALILNTTKPKRPFRAVVVDKDFEQTVRKMKPEDSILSI